MHWIPDVPKTIEDQIERESLITQKSLWETKPEVRSSSTYGLGSLLNREKSYLSSELNEIVGSDKET
jgi:hypothetical protein